jgi:hypothetical protein
MAYYYKDGSGIDQWAYIYVQLQVTRTDYPTYSHFSVKSVAVSDTGTSSFIRGQVTTNQGGTSWTAATDWKSVSYNGTTTLATATFDVTRGASEKTARIGAYAQGGGTSIYSGGEDYAWLNVTVPKVLAPNAPTGCTATYVSDSQASVSWTNGTTDSDHPRDATLVERRDGSNNWAQVASASGTASGYTDNGISPNTQYQYRVRAKNVAGYSAYSTSGSIYTTPAAPASVTLDKTAATTVQVDVTGTWGYAVTYDIESTYDGGSTWASVATSTSLPYSATVNAGTVQFRVRAVRGALSSAWTNSASLVTICPPLAPTIVSAPSGSIANGSTATVSWTPNHPDGSAQSAAEVKVTYPGGSSTTFGVTTATSWTSNALTTNGTYNVQVRTKGLDPSYGEWSQTVSWGVYNPPAVVITSPATDGTDVVSLPMTVSWSVTDSTGVSTQRIIIEGSDGEILNRTLAGDVRTVALNASDVALENGQTYTIRLRVMGGSGLVTEQTRIFDVTWLAPAAPVLQLTEGEGSSATIDVMDTRYTSSGTVLGASSSMMESLTIHGASVQDGTPTPSTPVEIRSVGLENLLDASTYQVGVYSINSDGSLHVTGADGRAWASATKNTPHLPNGTYYWESDVPVRIQLGTTYVIHNGNGTSGMFALGISAGAQLTVKIMAATGTSYPFDANVSLTRLPLQEPVQMGATAVQLRSAGLNMLPNGKDDSFTNAATKVTVTRTDGVYTFAGTSESTGGRVDSVYSQNCCRVPAGTYRATAFYSGTGALTMHVHKVTTSTTLVASTNQVGAVVSTPAFTVNEGESLFIGFNVAENNTAYNATARVMLTRGADAPTAYTAYNGSTTPIPVTLRSLPDGTHDEWVSGETEDTLIKKVGIYVFDGSESWGVNPNVGSGFAFSPKPSDMASGDGAASVPLMRVDRFEPRMASTGGNVYASGPNLLFYRDGSSFNPTSTDEAHAWFAANPTTVIYKLATPITTTLPHVNLPYVDGSAWVDAEVTPQIEATFRPVDFPDQPKADSVDVQRVNADGTAWTVATGLTVGGSCIDPLPPLGVPVTYRAISSAASGSTASGEFTETFGGRDWVLNFGNAAQEHVEFIYNPQADLSLKQGGALYHFADGGAGKGLPLFYPTTDRDMSGTLQFDTVLYGDSDRLLDLCDRYPVAWLRDPFGHRWLAQVTPSASREFGQLWPVTISWYAVRFEEAWNG